jgi:GNAT superfamily N-acetyltransferase
MITTYWGSAMEKKWFPRKYREGDEKGVLELYEAIYGDVEDKDNRMKWWEWQHKNHPAGAPLIWLADSDGRLAGQYEVVRSKMNSGSDVFMASYSQDTMTHPDFRRQGIFKDLANKTYNQCKAEGIDIVFGFPNENSHPGFVNKLDWFDVCLVPRVFKPLNIENTLKRRIRKRVFLKLVINFARLYFLIFRRSPKPPKINGLKITKIKSFDDRFDDLWKRASKNYKIMVSRNSKYLNWRYVEIPHRKYAIFSAEKDGKIFGYIVLSCVEKEDFKGGEIIDFFGDLDGNILKNLLYKATEYFREKKVDSIYCWQPSNKLFKKIFKEYGFFHHSPTPPFIVRRNTSRFSKEYLINYDNWFITMGDSDFH